MHIPKEKRQKLDAKSVRCILVGYQESAGSRVYRLYEPIGKRFLISRDVIIDQSPVILEAKEVSDTMIGWRNATKALAQEEETSSESDFRPLDTITPSTVLPAADIDIQETITLRPTMPPPTTTDSRATRGRAREAVREQTPSVPRRSQRKGNPSNNSLSQANYAVLAGAEELEPQTLTEALSGTQKAEWRLAWLSELESLAKNETWVMERLPAGRTAIGCRWLFRRKGDGRFKPRLVAKGYSQLPGRDYEETFAPVAKFTTIRTLLALACENDGEMEGMDVKTVFLNGTLGETIYMEVPEDVQIPTTKTVRHYQQPVACRLIKAIYGLKQSPAQGMGEYITFTN